MIYYINSFFFYLFFICYPSCFFFFNDTATTEIYTLSLHDALPIWCRAAPLASISLMSGQESRGSGGEYQADEQAGVARLSWRVSGRGRKSTRLDSSHQLRSYAVVCLKEKHAATNIVWRL